MKRLILGSFVAFALAASPAAAEQISVETSARAVPVSYSDLDAAQTGDAAALLSRLRYAAYRACERRELDLNLPTPPSRRETVACRTRALDAAVAQLNQPELTRLHIALRR